MHKTYNLANILISKTITKNFNALVQFKKSELKLYLLDLTTFNSKMTWSQTVKELLILSSFTKERHSCKNRFISHAKSMRERIHLRQKYSGLSREYRGIGHWNLAIKIGLLVLANLDNAEAIAKTNAYKAQQLRKDILLPYSHEQKQIEPFGVLQSKTCH